MGNQNPWVTNLYGETFRRDRKCLHCLGGEEHSLYEHRSDIERTNHFRETGKTASQAALELLNPGYARRLASASLGD